MANWYVFFQGPLSSLLSESFLDGVYVILSMKDLLNRYSVYPAIVVQEKLTPSDINSDNDVGVRDSFWLVDSALERVRLWDELGTS